MSTTLRDEQQDPNKKLAAASAQGVIEDIWDALTKGADVNAEVDEHKQTNLHLAVRNSKALKVLVEAGADVDAKNSTDNAPMHWAAWENRIDSVKILLAAGARLDFDLTNADGKTPIDRARDRGNTELADYMESVANGKTPRPTPEEVGLNMKRREASLAALKRGERPVVGYTATASAPRGKTEWRE